MLCIMYVGRARRFYDGQGLGERERWHGNGPAVDSLLAGFLVYVCGGARFEHSAGVGWNDLRFGRVVSMLRAPDVYNVGWESRLPIKVPCVLGRV